MGRTKNLVTPEQHKLYASDKTINELKGLTSSEQPFKNGSVLLLKNKSQSEKKAIDFLRRKTLRILTRFINW